MTNSKMRDALENARRLISESMQGGYINTGCFTLELIDDALSSTPPTVGVSEEMLRNAAGKLIANCHPAYTIEKSTIEEFVSVRREHWANLIAALSHPSAVSTLQDQNGVKRAEAELQGIVNDTIEACAKMADHHLINQALADVHGYRTACKSIADDIRALKSPTPNGETP